MKSDQKPAKTKNAPTAQTETDKKRKQKREAQKRWIKSRGGTVTDIQKTIGATFPKKEAETIAELLHAHGVKPADVIRATAYALTTSSDTATTADEIRNAARLWRDSQTATGDTSNADQTDTDAPTE